MILKYQTISKCIQKSACLILNTVCVQITKDVVANPSEIKSSWSLILTYTMIHHCERKNFSLNLFHVFKGLKKRFIFVILARERFMTLWLCVFCCVVIMLKSLLIQNKSGLVWEQQIICTGS